MGKNSKKGQRPKVTVQTNPNNVTIVPGPFLQIVGIEIDPPRQWPEAKRRLHANVENSLALHPQLSHLSVLPPGCRKLIVEARYPVANAA